MESPSCFTIQLPQNTRGEADYSSQAWKKDACILAASGRSMLDISRALNIGLKEVSVWLKTDEAKIEITNLSRVNTDHELEVSSLKGVALQAVFTLQELMLRGSSENVRLNAAKEVLDRVLGKSTTRVIQMSEKNLDPEEEVKMLREQLSQKLKRIVP